MYATGLGVTTGGKVQTGLPAPKLLAVTPAGISTIELLPVRHHRRMEWPGPRNDRRLPDRPLRARYSHERYVLLAMIKIGGVSSPVTGAIIPTVSVN